ncbi:MAG TPA: sodium:alanine symporter family protein [Longimicrobiales bacterium]|nr:sodium:alanine symporter family protein [Longimicrobiales bacterium]
MEVLERIIGIVESIAWWGPSIGGESIPLAVIMLLGTGLFLTVRLGFVQLRRLGHGFAVTTGRYDDPNEPGDVSHFQALSTALSATVGIGNIAGVAIALHWGGPGALFWMWVTAFLGMATKFTEVTLAQHYRVVEGVDRDPAKWEGTVSGGPMYYIERGLGPSWRPLAVLFAVLLGITAFMTGNAIQANTLADTMNAQWGIPVWITGLVSAAVVGAVIIGGITRIGRVTGILAPLMAAIYVGGALLIILLHIGDVIPTFALIFREAFNPSAGVAGTGLGALLVTLMWGVRRGLFSNEAGQGSAPIAHAAAKTDEPVSEGVVALLEPFIDTLVICTMTGLVIIMTGAWDDKHPTTLNLGSGDISWNADQIDGSISRGIGAPAQFEIVDGLPVAPTPDAPRFAWHDVRVDQFFTDVDQTVPFTGTIYPGEGRAVSADGQEYRQLYGNAVRNGAPLTMAAFERGIGRTGANYGQMIVILGVILFAVSTAISWSYYGDRCANYLFGSAAVIPYRIVFVIMHFVGAILPLASIWALGDAFLGVVIFPNLLALLLLSGKVKELTDSYFDRKPWVENAEVHKRIVEEKRTRR